MNKKIRIKKYIIYKEYTVTITYKPHCKKIEFYKKGVKCASCKRGKRFILKNIDKVKDALEFVVQNFI